MTALDPRISQALIEAVDTRVEQLMRMQPQTRYGIVESVNTSTATASVYLGGDTTPSPGFKYQRALPPAVGELVRVTIDPRGDRYVEATPGGLTVGDPAGAQLGKAAALVVRRTAAQSITNSTYTALTTWAAPTFDGALVSWDGTDEIVVAKTGLWLISSAALFDTNTTGIRLVAFDVNDVTNAVPAQYFQSRIGVNADANADWAGVTTPVPLNANDRVCCKVWQNSGGALNVTTAQLAAVFLGEA